MSDYQDDFEQDEQFNEDLDRINQEQQQKLKQNQQFTNIEALKPFKHKSLEKHQNEQKKQIKKYYKNPKSNAENEDQNQFSQAFPDLKINNLEKTLDKVEIKGQQFQASQLKPFKQNDVNKKNKNQEQKDKQKIDYFSNDSIYKLDQKQQQKQQKQNSDKNQDQQIKKNQQTEEMKDIRNLNQQQFNPDMTTNIDHIKTVTSQKFKLMKENEILEAKGTQIKKFDKSDLQKAVQRRELSSQKEQQDKKIGQNEKKQDKNILKNKTGIKDQVKKLSQEQKLIQKKKEELVGEDEYGKKQWILGNQNWNQNKKPDNISYSGGFRIPESQIKLKNSQIQNKNENSNKLDNSFDQLQGEERRQKIFEKLGIMEVPNINNQEEFDQFIKNQEHDMPEEYFNQVKNYSQIKDEYIYSTKENEAKQQLNSQLIKDIEHKREQLNLRRELLLNKSQNLKKIDELAQELAEDKNNKEKIIKQKVQDPNDLINEEIARVMNYQNLIGIEIDKNGKEVKQKDDFPYFYLKDKNVEEQTERETRPFLDQIENLINETWQKEKPNLDIVEQKLQEHREKMKQVELMYQSKRMTVTKDFFGFKSHYINEEEELKQEKEERLEKEALQNERIERDFGDLQIKNLDQEQEQQNKAHQLINNYEEGQGEILQQKKELTLEEREEKRLQILKEMRELDRQIDKIEKKGNNKDKFNDDDNYADNLKIPLKPSQKVFENEQFIDPKKKLYQQQFQEYLIDKQIQEQENQYKKQLDLPQFERYRLPEKEEKYRKLHQQDKQEVYPVTNRPVKIINDFEQLEKEQLMYQMEKQQEQKREGVTNLEEVQFKEQKSLVKTLMKDKKERAYKLKQKDEEIILKFLFQEICKQQKSKYVSKQETYEYLRGNIDAITFFELKMDTFYIDLERLETQRLGLLNYQEFSEFVRDQPQISKETLKAKRLFLEHKYKEEEKKLNLQAELLYKNEMSKGSCLLNQQEIQTIQQVFEENDEDNSGFLEKNILLEGILFSEKTHFMLQLPAVKSQNKQQNLEQVIKILQNSAKCDNYLSFNRLMIILKNFDNELGLNKQGIFKNQNQNQNQQNQNDKQNDECETLNLTYSIKNEYLILLQDVFDSEQRVYQDYIDKNQFIESALSDPQVRSFKNDIGRMNKKTREIFSIEAILNQIQQKCSQYIDFSAIEYFFSDQFDENQIENYVNMIDETHDFFLKKQQTIQNKLGIQQKSFGSKENLNNQNMNQTNQRKNYKQFHQMLDEMEEEQEENQNLINKQQFNQLNEIDKFNKKFYANSDDQSVQEYANLDQQFFQQKRVFQNQEKPDIDIVTKKQLQEFDSFYKDLQKKHNITEVNVGGVMMKVEDTLQEERDKQKLEKDDNVTNLKKYKVDYNTYFGKSKNNKDKKQVTVPKPPSMLTREKKMTIQEQKMQEFLQKKQEEEKNWFKFKANPYPIEYNKEHLFETKKQNMLDNPEFIRTQVMKEMMDLKVKQLGYYEEIEQEKQDKIEQLRQEKKQKEEQNLQEYLQKKKELEDKIKNKQEEFADFNYKSKKYDRSEDIKKDREAQIEMRKQQQQEKLKEQQKIQEEIKKQQIQEKKIRAQREKELLQQKWEEKKNQRQKILKYDQNNFSLNQTQQSQQQLQKNGKISTAANLTKKFKEQQKNKQQTQNGEVLDQEDLKANQNQNENQYENQNYDENQNQDENFSDFEQENMEDQQQQEDIKQFFKKQQSINQQRKLSRQQSQQTQNNINDQKENKIRQDNYDDVQKQQNDQVDNEESQGYDNQDNSSGINFSDNEFDSYSKKNLNDNEDLIENQNNDLQQNSVVNNDQEQKLPDKIKQTQKYEDELQEQIELNQTEQSGQQQQKNTQKKKVDMTGKQMTKVQKIQWEKLMKKKEEEERQKKLEEQKLIKKKQQEKEAQERLMGKVGYDIKSYEEEKKKKEQEFKEGLNGKIKSDLQMQKEKQESLQKKLNNREKIETKKQHGSKFLSQLKNKMSQKASEVNSQV
ncbi:hypothetical protein PPERSA_08843 [Pseudocohnilembus persalinus]|uniref:EF-hand domain-containing protein n=1 Tax=Pseudocohnilembus persalinus TaxID=266149 RepID=A0A0V0R3T1_PSEPJ|nr:hypothetical protein PPERSA_08843 [Pseudocohnilembus persalinus]|eukprot:KRX09127.1 hypothetical protein PPERSA_08843 [Pseudocohnilembus persalinus]